MRRNNRPNAEVEKKLFSPWRNFHEGMQDKIHHVTELDVLSTRSKEGEGGDFSMSRKHVKS